MFTEGLDNSALKWVKEGSMNSKKEEPFSVLNTGSRIDPILNRSGSRGFGLPPPAKFRSGHLPPTALPGSRVIPGDDSASVSGNDISSESEEEDVYGGRYSLDSSPQDDRAPPSIASSYRYSTARSLPPTRMSYGSDYLSSDVYSSVELTGQRGERSVKGNGRYPVGRNGYAEDESEDSAGSSEFSSSQVGSNIHTASRSRLNASEDYASSVTSRMNVGKDDGETPSAPPVCSVGQDTSQTEHLADNKVYVDSHGANIQNEPDVPSITPDGTNQVDNTENKIQDSHARTTSCAEPAGTSGSHAARLPTFHASSQGPWHSVVAYDACVRLCLNAWARGCMEAPIFLENECTLLRSAFGLQQILLQSEEEILAKRGSELANEGAPQKPKKMIGKMKVQVRKVRVGLDPPTGCSFVSVKAPVIKESARLQLSKVQRSVLSGWHALRRVRFVLHKPAEGSLSKKSLAYVQASTQYIKQVSGLLKVGVVTTLRHNAASYEPAQESHCCLLRLKSSPEGDAIRMQPGSGETHVFFPDGLGDDLIVEVQDSKGKTCGRVIAQVATVADDPNDKLRWWSIFHEPAHELVGKIQLYINFSTTTEESNNNKCGSVAETVAYDLVLETAMKIQHFQQRHLLLHGEWKWLLEEFATYYGVSDAYTKLRYLSYVMDVATPTADCLTLVHDLLYPVVMKGHTKSTLSHQENRILGEVQDQIEQILALAFENYKSLDESLSSGILDVFQPANGQAAPALQPAVKLYTLLHDILSPEAQNKLCRHFQAAAKKRSKRHLSETDEYVNNAGEGNLLDHVSTSTAYQKMRTLCLNIRNEVSTDIEIHNQNILPSFVDLPNLSTSIYSVELCNRIREFLIACPPSGPSQPVAELVIATADFQRDLVNWNINPIKGGVDAKELFHLYIVVWIQDKRLALLETCKLDKVKWSGVRTQHSTTPFVDEMYDRLKETSNDYEVIISRWPEYSFALENAFADVEKAIVETLDRQYSDVLAPLKENLAPKKFGFKYVQKLTKRTVHPYVIPDEVGILLNSMKRMLDVLRPRIETQFKSWGSCLPSIGNQQIPGERLSEVTVMLRAKFRNYLQAIVEKLVENTKLQNSTKIKKILQDSKESVGEPDVRNRMQPLKEQLKSTINHLHTIFETHVFISICRGYWDRIGQDVLSFLENRKENKAWYKGSTIAVSVLDDTFASQMQQLLGNSLQDKDIEPPRSMMEVRSMLCKDGQSNKRSTFYY